MHADTAADRSPPLDPVLLEAIEDALVSRLDASGLDGTLGAACRHAVLAGGKRLRPILVLEAARAAGGSVEEAMPAAVAIEFVHAFSLVHDDLPALDDDDLRRGRPTCHIAYGEAAAILAGDALLTLAPLEAARVARNGGRVAIELMQATLRMIEGQVHDTLREFPEEMPETERLELIHRRKTGALIECACRMGAVAAGADDTVLAALDAYGRATGLMFQVVDDLIDATQSSEHAGKATGKDAAAGKLTYPGVHGVEASREAVRRLHADSWTALAPLGERGAPLRRLADFLAARTR